MSASERLEKFQLHAAKCQTINSEYFSYCRYSIDSCLFRVVYDTSNRSTFIVAPEFAPLAYPAFTAGCPTALDCIEMQILHCGGETNHRESTPYISCSTDLLWCLLSSAIAILRGTASNVQVWFIDNTRPHHDLQYNVWQEEHWDKLSNNVQSPDINIAKEHAVSSSEVLVYKEISRERIIGVLNLDLEKIKRAPAKFGSWTQETLEKMWSHSFAICKYFLENPDDSDDLVDWCEYNIETTVCIEDICRVCAVYAVYKALHPLSRDHIFIGSHLIQMKSELHKMFTSDWEEDSPFWRQKYLRKHQDNHKWCIYDHNDELTLEEGKQKEIIDELTLDVKMEGLNFGYSKN